MDSAKHKPTHFYKSLTASTSLVRAMVSVDHSSPPTIILCLNNTNRFTLSFEFSLELENDPHSLKPHHLSPLCWSRNKVHEKEDLLYGCDVIITKQNKEFK